MNIVSRIPLEKQTLETIMVLKHKLWVNWVVLFFYVFFFFFLSDLWDRKSDVTSILRSFAAHYVGANSFID